MSDGRVGFSRWEHRRERPRRQADGHESRCNADDRHRRSVRQPGNSLVQFTESQTAVRVRRIVTNRENTIQAGSLVKIDARWTVTKPSST